MLHRKLDGHHITDGDGRGIHGGLQLRLGFLGQSGADPEKKTANAPDSAVPTRINRKWTVARLTPDPSPALGRGGPKSLSLVSRVLDNCLIQVVMLSDCAAVLPFIAAAWLSLERT